MRAVRVREFGDPSVLKIEEVPAPEPGPGQVQVRVRAAGVNPVDTYIRSGRYAKLPTLPYVPGSDGAGVIAALGSGVEKWKVGQRVFFFGTAESKASGAYAELAVCNADAVYPLPGRVSFAQGAAIGIPYATAHRALFGRGRGRAGEIVFVHGASGGVGIAALQLARWRGLSVIGTAGTEEGLSLVRANGAHFAVSHRAALYLDQIRDATQGKGPNLIIEMLANVNLDSDLGLVAQRGRVVIVGSRGKVEIDPRQTMTKDSTILGFAHWNTDADELNAIYTDIVAGLESEALTPAVGREYPLADAAKAHDAVMAAGAKGKIALIP
ncbi:MAG: NADPH:quinone reductase [Gemmatimonadales bacterium]